MRNFSLDLLRCNYLKKNWKKRPQEKNSSTQTIGKIFIVLKSKILFMKNNNVLFHTFPPPFSTPLLISYHTTLTSLLTFPLFQLHPFFHSFPSILSFTFLSHNPSPPLLSFSIIRFLSYYHSASPSISSSTFPSQLFHHPILSHHPSPLLP